MSSSPRWRKDPNTVYRSGGTWGSTAQVRDLKAKMYSAKDLADALGISVRTIHRLRKSGKLTATQLGRAVRFPAAALKAAIKAGHHLKM